MQVCLGLDYVVDVYWWVWVVVVVVGVGEVVYMCFLNKWCVVWIMLVIIGELFEL